MYEPQAWNTRKELRETHNCFSYAMNVNDPKQIARCAGKPNCRAPFHQPGSAAGYEGFSSGKPKTCPNMFARLFGDNPGMRPVGFEEKCPRNSSKIALVVDQSDDYHFLRQDGGRGFWSQKSGAMPVTDRDAGGHKIWDPQLCDLDFRKRGSNLNYDIFCGYLCVPRDRAPVVKIGGGGATRRRSR
jgi:hypothetical protein